MDDDDTYDLVKVVLEYLDEIVIQYWTPDGRFTYQTTIPMSFFDLDESELEWKHWL